MKVSVILPTYNEEDFIGAAIESLTDDFVREHGEILVIDGKSEDRTVEIVESYIRKGFPIRFMVNEKRLQCFALNQAIEAAQGELIVRVDAHSAYPPGYVKRLAELSRETGAANVGGVMAPRGRTPVQQAIAYAMRHPVGVGNARFHLGDFKGYVDTVYLGAFRRDIFEKAGMFDTNCGTNEDAELNIRILKLGEKIYLDSSIEVEYSPRPTFKKLAVQYFKYGLGRAYTTVKHRMTTSFRQWVPPLLVLSLLGTAIAGIFWPWFFLFWALYPAAVLGAAIFTWSSRRIGLKHRLLMAAAFIIMHTVWGAGFLCFFLKRNPGKRAVSSEKENNEKEND